MRKLKIGILLLLSCLMITACSCSKKEEDTTEEYKVTFNSNGGTSVRTQTVEEGKKAKEPTDPTRAGYTFMGWYLDLDDIEEYDFDTKVTKNITLIAKWSSSTEASKGFVVSFETSDGSVRTINVEPGQTIPIPSTPTRYGYKFVEWQLNGQTYDFSTPVTGDITLKAVWEEIEKYLVTFNSDGGSNISSKYVYKGYRVSKPTDPTKENYIFDGWYLNGSLYDFTKPVYKNIELVANWREPYLFEVTFDSKGGSEVESQQVVEGGVVTVPSVPTKSGYAFNGWLLNGEPYDFNTKVYDNFTLVASWVLEDTNFSIELAKPAEGNNLDSNLVENISKLDLPKVSGNSVTITEKERLVSFENEGQVEGEYYALLVDLEKPLSEIKSIESNCDYASILTSDIAGYGATGTEFVLLLTGDYTEKTCSITFKNTQDEELKTINVTYKPVTIGLSVKKAVPDTTVETDIKEPNREGIIYNQKNITVSDITDGVVTVTEDKILESWTSNGTVNGRWFGLVFDLNIPVTDLEVVSENITCVESEDNSCIPYSESIQAKRFGGSNTSFVLWLTAEKVLEAEEKGGLTYTFRDKKLQNSEEQTVTIKFVEATPEVDTAGTTSPSKDTITETFGEQEAHKSDIAKNQGSIEVTTDEETNTITVKQIGEMQSWQSDNHSGKWFAVLVDVGIPLDRLEVTSGNYEVKDEDKTDAKTKFGATSDTAFVIWLADDQVPEETGLKITFKDRLTGKTVDVTIKFEKLATISLNEVDTANILSVPTETNVINEPTEEVTNERETDTTSLEEELAEAQEDNSYEQDNIILPKEDEIEVNTEETKEN